MPYKTLSLAIVTLLFSQVALAEDKDDEVADLGTLTITATKARTLLAFDDSKKASDLTVQKSSLQHRSATLGNALAGEVGVHSNPFGGGASAPVVRGQEGVRVKVLQNGLGVADMSTISPDHAVAVDTLLASRVEIVRGASTLMHANASTAGVINVADNRILSKMPRAVTGESMFRYTTGSHEKMALAGLSVPVGRKFALRAEVMGRDAKPYNVPAINFGEILTYLPDSQNRSKVGSLGLSYIGNQGYFGLSWSERADKYGLVGHNHKFDGCSGHILDSNNTSVGRAYLNPYPHLMQDEDIIGGLHFHCGTDYDQDPAHSHDNVYGHQHDHTQKAPWVDMKVRTIGASGELLNFMPSIDKIAFQASKSRYRHSEFDEGKTIKDPACTNCTKFVQGNTVEYANDALLGKLSVYQSPNDKLSLVWGVDAQTNRTSALIPNLSEKISNRRPLVKNTQKTVGLFGLSQYQLGKWRLEAGVRHENTHMPIEYNLDEIKAQIDSQSSATPQSYPDLSAYRNDATSYALSALWDLSSKTRLDATFSHNERLPTPMELYYHGKHLATNSFLYGNRHLNKEKSDNMELGINYRGDKWWFKSSAYANRFNNYIHPENLYKHGNLTMRRFTESKADIRGAEVELGYHFTPNQSIALFGDVVRGRLHGFAPTLGNDIYGAPVVVGYEDPDECGIEADDPEYEEWCAITKTPVIGKDVVARPDRSAPRMSPARLGFRLNGDYGNFSTMLEYTRMFAQNRVSHSVATKYDSECPHHEYGRSRLCPIHIYEDITDGYHLLNVGVDYHRVIGQTDTTWSLRGNNLLNEKVYVHNSFLPFVPQQGRNVSLAVNMKF